MPAGPTSAVHVSGFSPFEREFLVHATEAAASLRLFELGKSAARWRRGAGVSQEVEYFGFGRLVRDFECSAEGDERLGCRHRIWADEFRRHA